MTRMDLMDVHLAITEIRVRTSVCQPAVGATRLIPDITGCQIDLVDVIMAVMISIIVVDMIIKLMSLVSMDHMGIISHLTDVTNT